MSKVLVQFGIPKRSARKISEAKWRKRVTRNKMYPIGRSSSQLRSSSVFSLCLAFKTLAQVAATPQLSVPLRQEVTRQSCPRSIC